jgi:CheY-like chemotaxis protein
VIEGLKVLIVEDDARNLMALSTQLRGLKIDFKRNTNGVGVFEQTLLLQPDVILLDIDLPYSDSFQICRRIRTDGRTASVPIVALTGQLFPGLVKHLAENGFTTYLVLPTKAQELSKVLQMVFTIATADDARPFVDHRGYA